MRIERVVDAAAVHLAADLFDEPPLADATEKFLARPDHHLLFAYLADRAVGMISGVEMTHPDKGTEMFVYELGVAPVARLQGVGTALVRALADVARERGCYGMWVSTEVDNEAAQATYRRAGATEETPFVLLNWDLTGGGSAVMTFAESRRGWLTPMRARSADENHRVATPLELFFDLCFVVAVAQAAVPLHHDISENHVWHGVTSYLMVFFAIWWAWMNFTWFASAYDTDDDVYRITSFVQIAGALVLAAGVSSAFDDGNYLGITLGYVVMRLAMVAQWLRAARADPQRRATALRYAAGITIVQLLWLARLALPEEWSTPTFLLLVVGELLVPILAERAPGGPTTWHPHHIAERYGLFTIIMLGEAVSAATIAIRTGLDTGEHVSDLVSVAIAGLIIVFALWWLYFDRSAQGLLTSVRAGMLWGYGHYFIFASAAAAGVGVAVAVDYDTHHADISGVTAGYAMAVPVAVYLFFVWLLHIRPHQRGPLVVAYPAVAALTLMAPFGPAPVHVIAGLLVVLVAITVGLGRRVPDRIDAGHRPG